MGDYKVSEVACKAYSNGAWCHRQNLEGGCPYVHNANDRRDAIAAKRAAREQAEKAKKITAEKNKERLRWFKKQHEYDQLIASKNSNVANAPKAVETINNSITPPASNAGDAPVNGMATLKITLPLSPPPSPIHTNAGTVTPTTYVDNNNVTSNLVGTAKISPTEVSTVANGVASTSQAYNNHNANVGTTNVTVNGASIIVAGAWQTKYTTSKEQCKKDLTRRGCSNPTCRYVHNIKARREYIGGLDKAAAKLATEKVNTTSQVNRGNFNDDAKSIATYAYNAAQDISVAPQIITPILSAAPPMTFWGTEGGLAIWAKDNLRDHSQVKLLLPYNGLDQVPAEIMAKIKKSDKVNDGPVFYFFPALPGEIRNQIWGHAIDDAVLEGRQVHIQLSSGKNEDFDRIETRTRPPSLLHACSESRSLTKCAYKRAFLISYPDGPYYIPFNFEHDVLYIHTAGVAMQLSKIVEAMGSKSCRRIKHVVVSLKEYLGDRSIDKNYWGYYMSFFTNLKSLKLKVGDGQADLCFHRRSFRQGATFVLKEHLLNRWGKTVDPMKPSPADRAPKVTFEVVPAITARELNIDSLIYMGEGGWGTAGSGW